MFREERKDDLKVISFSAQAENTFYHITPNTLPVSWFRGVALYRTGNKEGAAAEFAKALKFTPFEVRVMNDYGITLYDIGKVDEGKSMLKKSISIDPFFDDAKFNLSAIYYFLGRPDSAYYYAKSTRDPEKKEAYLKELE